MPAITTLEDRIQIMESSEAGESAWRIAQRLRWRPSTVRKWRNRGRKLGRQGLVTRMGRPKVGALGSYSKEMHDTLLRCATVTTAYGRSITAFVFTPNLSCARWSGNSPVNR